MGCHSLTLHLLLMLLAVLLGLTSWLVFQFIVRVHAAFYYLNLALPAEIQRDLWHDLVLCTLSLKFN